MALRATNVLDLESQSSAKTGMPRRTTLWIVDLEEWTDVRERERLFYEKLQTYGHYIFDTLITPEGRAAMGEPQIRVLYLTSPTKCMLDAVSLRDRVRNLVVPIEFKSHAEFIKEHQREG